MLYPQDLGIYVDCRPVEFSSRKGYGIGFDLVEGMEETCFETAVLLVTHWTE